MLLKINAVRRLNLPQAPSDYQSVDGIQVGFLDRRDWEALPPALQPLLRHACTELTDGIQKEKVEACAPWAKPGMEEDRADDANASIYMQGAVVPRL